jgi:hypothetical protein
MYDAKLTFEIYFLLTYISKEEIIDLILSLVYELGL